jgi:hypothetical protein
MTSFRIIGVAAALTVSAWVGATATDIRVDLLTATIQAALRTDAQFDPSTAIYYPVESTLINSVVTVAFLLLLFGGLPVAIHGLLGHREWTRPAEQRLRFVHVPYAVLPFQIVSVLWSGIWLVALTPRVVSVLALGIVDGHDLFLPAYLAAQFVTGIAVIPVWRRHRLHTSRRPQSLFPSRT